MTLKKLIPLLLSFVLLTSCTARGEEQKDNPLSSITPEAPSTSSPLLKDENEDPPFIAAEPRHRVLVSYGEDKKDYLAQGSDTLLLTYRCRTPHVELPGQEMQAQEINMSLASLAESFRQGKDEESGLEHMLSSVATIYALEPDPSMFIPHAYERDCSTVRGDSKVISFLFSDYVNSGGAHGGTCWSGVNFNPATGKPLSLTDLSDDIDALRTLCLTEILAQCNGMKDIDRKSVV